MGLNRAVKRGYNNTISSTSLMFESFKLSEFCIIHFDTKAAFTKH